MRNRPEARLRIGYYPTARFIDKGRFSILEYDATRMRQIIAAVLELDDVIALTNDVFHGSQEDASDGDREANTPTLDSAATITSSRKVGESELMSVLDLLRQHLRQTNRS